MRIVNILVLFVVVALVAAAAVPAFVQNAWRPDLFAVVIAYVALRAPKRAALGLAWAAGLARDLSSGASLGAHALAGLIAAFVIIHVRTETENRSLASYVPYTAAVAAFAGATDGALLALGGAVLPAAPEIARSVAATAIVSLPCAWLLNRLGAWLGIRRRRRFGLG